LSIGCEDTYPELFFFFIARYERNMKM